MGGALNNTNKTGGTGVKKKAVHSGHRERVRERYIHHGLDVFADHEVLELLLFYCIPMRDTNELAHKMLDAFGTLHNLFDATPQEIARRCKVALSTAVLISMIPALYKRYSAAKWSKRADLSSSRKAGEYAISLFAGETNECFFMICLDSQSCLLRTILVSRGTVDETQIYPRKIVEFALQYNAVSVILVHNHPGTSLSPSKNDIEATRRIMETLTSIDVNVIDHIIVGGTQYFSFSEKRLLNLAY
ncbi:MAG: DNA repair protein RadC [Clostridiales bacterium]|jgi:DNA repair protein RadC|nr:DNA repair protein RadC [Clostridiales bacterium]